jgi:hypothetical protein
VQREGFGGLQIIEADPSVSHMGKSMNTIARGVESAAW